MATVFISYRRSTDPHVTARLRDRLAQHFDLESLFRDRDSIKAGNNWRQVLKTAVSSAKICLVVIGPEWISVKDDKGQQRLFRDDDWVRYEIETALRLDSVSVIPVLVKGATLPSDAALPPGMDGFANLQCVTMNEDYWDEGCERLRYAIGEITGLTKVRERLLTALIVLISGTCIGIVMAVSEFVAEDQVGIATHIGSLAVLTAGALALITRLFLQKPAKRLLKYVYSSFAIMLTLGVATPTIGWAESAGDYNSMFFESIIILIMIVAGGIVVHGVHKLASRL